MRNPCLRQTTHSLKNIKVKVNLIINTAMHIFQASLWRFLNLFLFADSLMHRAAFAEILHILDSNRKSEAVKFIEESTNNIVPR